MAGRPRLSQTDVDADTYLSEYFYDILKIAEEYHPTRIIFDELTPFVSFKNKEMLFDVFCEVTEILEDNDITNLFVMSERTLTQNVWSRTRSNSTCRPGPNIITWTGTPQASTVVRLGTLITVF